MSDSKRNYPPLRKMKTSTWINRVFKLDTHAKKKTDNLRIKPDTNICFPGRKKLQDNNQGPSDVEWSQGWSVHTQHDGSWMPPAVYKGHWEETPGRPGSHWGGFISLWPLNILAVPQKSCRPLLIIQPPLQDPNAEKGTDGWHNYIVTSLSIAASHRCNTPP